MREIPAPHQPHLLSSTDTLALWRCDESSSSAQFVDATGAYTTTSLTGTPAPADGLFRANPGGTGARVFTGTQRATKAGDAASTAALQATSLSVEMWFTPSSLASEQTVLSYGVTGSGGSSKNILLEVRLTTAGLLRAFWQQGSNVGVTVDAAAMTALNCFELHHIGIVKEPDPANTGKVRVRFYADGVRVDTVSNLTNCDGGASGPSWIIGAATGGVRPCSGTIDDVRVSKFAASDECVRDSYARGRRAYDVATLYASGAYETHMRVLVRQNGVFVDLTRLLAQQDPKFGDPWPFPLGYDFVDDVTLTEDVDAQGMTGKLRLRRNFEAVSIAPGVTYDPITAAGTLITCMSELKVETADVPLGTGVDGVGLDWQLAFHGFVSAISWPSEQMEIELVDRIAPLQDTWIEGNGSGGDRTYGSDVGLPVEGEMQKVIDDAKPAAGYVGGSISLFTPTSPTWNILPVTLTATQNVAQVLEAWATTIGWRCRFRWDDHRKEFRLTFYQPDRAKTWAAPMPLLDVNTVIDVSRVEIKRDDVRNVCEVYAQAQGDVDNTQTTRTSLRGSASSAGSIAAFGRRYCRITLGSDSPLQTSTLAQELADNVIADLAQPKADSVVEIAHRFGPDIEDLARWRADGLRWSADQDFAVVGVEHTLSAEKKRTALTMRGGFVIGQHARYFDWLVDARSHKKGRGSTAPKTPAGLTVTATLAGLHVEWTFPTNNGNRRYSLTEVHVSTTSGFTPSPSTLVKLVYGCRTDVTGVTPGTTVFVKVLHRDSMGNSSAASSQVSATPAFLSTSLMPAEWRAAFAATKTTNQTVTLGPLTPGTSTQVTWDVETFDVGGCFAANKFTAPVDGVYDFVATCTHNNAFGGAGVGLFWLKLRVNAVDTIIGPAETIASSNASGPLVVSGSLQLSGGDVVDVAAEDTVNHSKTTTTALLAGRCSFSGSFKFAT